MKQPFSILAVAVALLVCTGLQTPRVSKALATENKPQGLDANDTHAAVSLLGQVRSNISSWLWLKADLYLHNGVEMRPLTDDEKRQGVQIEAAAKDGHEELYKEASVTVVPSKERDFRGWFGDVERETTAYKDMHEHKHNDPIAALPLFRLMTLLDPDFIPGWTTGATIIARDHSKQATFNALNFLSNGLRENPENVEILSEIGYLHLTRRKDLEEAAVYFDRARAAGRMRVRELDDDERDNLEETYRWLALCYRNLGRQDALRSVVAEGLAAFPDDTVLNHMIEDPPVVLTEAGRQEWRREHRKGAPSKASMQPLTHEMN